MIDLIKQVTYLWVHSLLDKGIDVTPASFVPLPSRLASGALVDQLDKEWNSEWQSKNNDASVWKVCWKVFGARYASFIPFNFLRISVLFCQSQALAGLLNRLGDDTTAVYQLWLWGAAVILCTLVGITLHHWFFYLTFEESLRWKSALTGLVLRKSMRLSYQSLTAISTGFILNLVSNDGGHLMKMSAHLSFLFVSPLTVAISAWLLWQQLGVASLAGWAVLLAFLAIVSVCTHSFAVFRSTGASITDRRIQLVAQIVQGLRVIKMYAWEAPFLQRLFDLRASELRILQYIAMLRAVSQSLTVISPIIVAAAANVTAWWNGIELTPAKVFVSLVLFQFLQNEVAYFFPMSLESLAEARILFQRLSKLLCMVEVQRPNAELENGQTVDIADAALSWDAMLGCQPSGGTQQPNDNVNLLNNDALRLNVSAVGSHLLQHLRLQVRRSEIIVIFGPVGSGKSTLLLALLWELQPALGSVNVRGAISYVSQVPWVFNGTVRDNIVFGGGYDAAAYQQALRDACLEEDLRRFPLGDATVLGDNGVMASGGQRARVALARAFYARGDVMLLDDPLSAVDARSAQSLLASISSSALAKECTRVLVTHHLGALSIATRAFKIQDGRLCELSPGESVESPVASPSDVGVVEEAASSEDSAQLVSTETVHSGKITASLYRDYCKSACGWPGVAMLVVCFCAFAAINNATQWWLSKWIAEPHGSQAASEAAKRYGFLALGTVLVSLIAAAVAFVGFAKGAGKLHNLAADRMIRAPLFWIDSNPAGRILNRFSRDMGVLDDSLPFTLYEFLQSAAGLIGTLVLICTINPYLILPARCLL